MPGHLRAADAPEDLWRCHECGWKYSNHHPSAKHRRNHKKQCGRIAGLKKTSDLSMDANVVNGSSDDGSSDEEHHRSSLEAVALEKNGYHQAQPQSPNTMGSANVEQICDDRSNGLSIKSGESHPEGSVGEKTATCNGNLNLSRSRNSSETQSRKDQGRGDSRSAHVSKGQWTCRHCGWTYPNAHPSAKTRRKHKKSCGVGPQHAAPGGSSDEASSDDGIEPRESAGTPQPLTVDSSTSQGTDIEVSATETDPFKDVEGRATADMAQVSPESDSSDSLVLRGSAHLGGVVVEKLESGESQAAMVDEESMNPADEQAQTGAPDSAISVPPSETMNTKESHTPGDIVNRVLPNGVKPTDRDPNGTVGAHQSPRSVTSEQVDYKKPHLPNPSQRNFAREAGDQSIYGTEQGNSKAAQFQSPVMVGSRSLKASAESPKTPQSTLALQASARGEPLQVEERSSPGSPEGLVRSRVQIFEKLAGTSPQYLQKSVSPKTKFGSPGQHVGSRLQNGTLDTNSTQKNLQETTSDPRHPQFSERMVQSSTAELDVQSELQKAMSHVLHRGNFV